MRWLLLTLLAACWTGPVYEPSPANSSTETMRRRPRVAFESLTLERTACLGTCPAYTVTIFADGRVRWMGRANVESMGERVGHVSGAQLESLARKLAAIDFFSYDKLGKQKRKTDPCVYTSTGPNSGTTTCTFETITICSDTSHAVVTLERGLREHRVDDARCDHDSRTPLAQLHALIDDVAGTRDWIGH